MLQAQYKLHHILSDPFRSITDYAWETILTQSPHKKWGEQGGGACDNSSMQEFQKHKQALRVSNSFARGPAKGACRDFDGNYTEVNI